MKNAKEPKECNFPGCEVRVFKKGLCREHLEGNYYLGCEVEGCEADHFSQGRCKEHYRCAVAECDRDVFAKGRCKAHYNRRWKKKAGKNTETPMDAPVRGWGEKKFDVFTRIPQEYADIILREAGRKDGMYEKAKEILVAWAAGRKSGAASASL